MAGAGDGQIAHDDGTRSFRGVPLADVALLMLLWLIYLLPFTEALPFIDGIRDLQFALDIARGESWPLIGPVFANRFHLGPFGYYLQALPLAFGLPLSAVPIFLGAIAGSKFFLAYGFGREWIDRRYGLLFAAALALPGWSGLDFLNTTTPLLVPALLLAAAWCALRFLRGGAESTLYGSALAISLALQSHPSALVIALIPAAVCLRQVIAGRRWRALATAIGIGVLPLFPVLIAVSQSGWGIVLPQATTVTVAGSGHSLAGWMEALRGFAYGGPLTTLRTLGSADYGDVLAQATLILSLTGLFLLAAAARRDRRARLLGLLLIGVALMVFGARSNTPWYFLHPLTLAWAAAVAFGWHRWPHVRSTWVIAACTLAVLQAVLLRAHLAKGEGGFASAELMDVRVARGERGPQFPPWISIRHWNALAGLLCTDGARTLALHGALARAVDDQGGLAARALCSIDQLRLGGVAERHWIGLPRAAWAALQWSPQAKIGSIGVFQPDQVFSSGSHVLADPHRYPLRAPLGGADASRQFHLRLRGDAILTISQLSPALAYWAVDEIRADALAVAPLHVDSGMQVYRAGGDPARWVDWSFTVRASAQPWVDIVSVRPQHSMP